jgi:hypothetical protein
MSKGAGRVEQAIRTMIERHNWQRWFDSDKIVAAAFGPPPWTSAQQHSALRAMHKIVDGQPGWSVEPAPHHRVTFRFKPPHGVAKAQRVAAAHVLQRPTPVRQQAHEAAEQRRQRRVRRAQAKVPLPMLYFWTCGADTLSAFPAGLMGLPVGRKVVTIPGTEPTQPRPQWNVSEDEARQARDNVWGALAARAHDRDPAAGTLAMHILDMELAAIEKAETYRAINGHIAAAETIGALYRHITAVWQRADVVVLTGQWRLGRELIRQEEAMADGMVAEELLDEATAAADAEAALQCSRGRIAGSILTHLPQASDTASSLRACGVVWSVRCQRGPFGPCSREKWCQSMMTRPRLARLSIERRTVRSMRLAARSRSVISSYGILNAGSYSLNQTIGTGSVLSISVHSTALWCGDSPRGMAKHASIGRVRLPTDRLPSDQPKPSFEGNALTREKAASESENGMFTVPHTGRSKTPEKPTPAQLSSAGGHCRRRDSWAFR